MLALLTVKKHSIQFGMKISYTNYYKVVWGEKHTAALNPCKQIINVLSKLDTDEQNTSHKHEE